MYHKRLSCNDCKINTVWLPLALQQFQKTICRNVDLLMFMSLADQGGYFLVDPGPLSNLR